MINTQAYTGLALAVLVFLIGLLYVKRRMNKEIKKYGKEEIKTEREISKGERNTDDTDTEGRIDTGTNPKYSDEELGKQQHKLQDDNAGELEQINNNNEEYRETDKSTGETSSLSKRTATLPEPEPFEED